MIKMIQVLYRKKHSSAIVSVGPVSRRVIPWCCRSRSCICKLGATTSDGSWRTQKRKETKRKLAAPSVRTFAEILDSCCEMNHTDVARLNNSILTADAPLAADCTRLCDNVTAICPFTMHRTIPLVPGDKT